jgi:spore coat polysaccharide biosynthesis predicted glycosyltransferase SpsG
VRLASESPDDIQLSDDLLIVDLPGGVSRNYMTTLRRADPNRLLVLFDGTCDGRLDADLVVTPLERLAAPSNWVDFGGLRYQGPEYAILDAAYSGLPQRVIDPNRTPTVLVTMGGADPFGLTLQALQAMDSMPGNFHTIVALGPAFAKENEVGDWLPHATRSYELRRDASLARLMVASDLAVVSFGTSAYELAAAGLPAIALCISPDHVEAAEIFARGGSMISAGLWSTVSRERLSTMVHELLSNVEARMTMARAGQALIDGNGARRVADLLVAALAHRAGG